MNTTNKLTSILPLIQTNPVLTTITVPLLNNSDTKKHFLHSRNALNHALCFDIIDRIENRNE